MEELQSWADLEAYLTATQRDVQVFYRKQTAIRELRVRELLRFTHLHEGAELAFGVHGLSTPAQMLALPPAGPTDEARPLGPTTWFGLAVKICPAEKIRPRPALVANFDLAIGALTIAQEWIVLHQTLPLVGLGTAHLARAIQALALLSTQLRHASGGGDDAYAYIFR